MRARVSSGGCKEEEEEDVLVDGAVDARPHGVSPNEPQAPKQAAVLADVPMEQRAGDPSSAVHAVEAVGEVGVDEDRNRDMLRHDVLEGGAVDNARRLDLDVLQLAVQGDPNKFSGEGHRAPAVVVEELEHVQVQLHVVLVDVLPESLGAEVCVP